MNNGKAKIENSIGFYKITVPSKKNWFTLIFGTVWMGGWYFGFKSAITDFGLVNNGSFDSFTAFWLIGWTIGGIGITSILLWGYFGKETLEFESQYVKFKKTIFGFGIIKNLTKNEIKNFRFEKVNQNMFNDNGYAFWGLGTGKIKFDYGLKSYSFGLAVDDAEANYLVEELNKKIQ